MKKAGTELAAIGAALSVFFAYVSNSDVRNIHSFSAGLPSHSSMYTDPYAQQPHRCASSVRTMSKRMPLRHIAASSISPPRRHGCRQIPLTITSGNYSTVKIPSEPLSERKGSSALERSRSPHLHVPSSASPFFPFLTSHSLTSTPNR
jgi:hypothetical protein